MITIIGDHILDEYVSYRTTSKISPETGVPILNEIPDETMYNEGGSGAVKQMVMALGEFPLYLGKGNTAKTRITIDGKELYRIDDDVPYTDSIDLSEIEDGIVLVADYGKGVVSDDLLARLFKLKGIRIIVDPARGVPIERYEGAFGILPNRVEAGISKTLRQDEAIIEAHAFIAKYRKLFRHITVKLDKFGMLCDDLHFPSTCEQVIDVCGAGDMVLAATGVYLHRGHDWIESCKFANKMAGLKCQQRGAKIDLQIGDC